MTSRSNADRAAAAVDLPPGWSAIALREVGDAMAHARAIAQAAGAGTLVHVRRFDSVELAVVLEPDEALATARRAIYVAMAAAADALAAHSPPGQPITFEWPDTVLLNGGILGGARLASPEGVREDETPDWLVVGLLLRTVVPHVADAGRKAGTHVLDQGVVRGTSLEIEGAELLDSSSLIGSFVRHLMVGFDLWCEQGFAAVAAQFLARLEGPAGVERRLDATGDLLIGSFEAAGGPARKSLRDALAAPQWLDPATGAPWL